MTTLPTVEAVSVLTSEIEHAISALLPQLSTSAVFDSERLRKVVEGDCTQLFLARSEGTIVGTLTLVVFPIPTGLRAHIDDVVVDTNARGLGLARLLIDAAIQHAAGLGAKTIDLSSRPSREPAIRLYKSVGFEERESRLYRLHLG